MYQSTQPFVPAFDWQNLVERGDVVLLNRPDFTGGCFVQRQATLSSVFRFA